MFWSSTNYRCLWILVCSFSSTYKLLTSLVYESWGWPSDPAYRTYLDHNSRIRVSSIRLSRTSYYEIRRRRIFFLRVASRKKGKNWVPTSYLQGSPSSFFYPTSRSNQESEGFFLPTSYIQGQVRESQGSRWVQQGWSVATRRGREKNKKRKEKDQGRWSVATRRGREKNKKRKEKKKTKEGEKVAPAKAWFRVP